MEKLSTLLLMQNANEHRYFFSVFTETSFLALDFLVFSSTRKQIDTVELNDSKDGHGITNPFNVRQSIFKRSLMAQIRNYKSLIDSHWMGKNAV